MKACANCGGPSNAGLHSACTPAALARQAAKREKRKVMVAACDVVEAEEAAPESEALASQNCGGCGAKNIQRVAAAFRAGTWAESGSTVGLGAGSVAGRFAVAGGLSTTVSAGGTMLAQALSPPLKPEPVAEGAVTPMVLLLLGACLLILGFVGVVPSFGAAAVTVVLGVGLIFGGLILMPLSPTLEDAEPAPEMQERVELWKRAMIRWERLLYCDRCGRVTEPATRKTCDVADLNGRVWMSSEHW